jgi:hypothetical protein
MDAISAISLAEAIVEAIIKLAPSIEAGIVSSVPYAQAIAGLIQGTNATQEQIDTLMSQLATAEAQFQAPLSPDDGTTST